MHFPEFLHHHHQPEVVMTNKGMPVPKKAAPAPDLANGASNGHTNGYTNGYDASSLPDDIRDARLHGFDDKLFAQELVRDAIAPKVFHVNNDATPTETQVDPKAHVSQGTWGGTQLAVTDMYNRIEQSYCDFFSATGMETRIPLRVVNRNKLYEWYTGDKDQYPPHLHMIPPIHEKTRKDLFNILGIAEAALLLPKIVPTTFVGKVEGAVLGGVRRLAFGDNYEGSSFADLERKNENFCRRRTATDDMQGENIGDLPDWWSDARFAQQHFTGANPATIEGAGPWADRFREAAQAQNSEQAKAAAAFIENADPKSLFVQDSTYYRNAAGMNLDEVMCSDDGKYCAAPIVLLHLQDNGQLHPLAICLDFKGDMEKSVVIFNKRLTPIDHHSADAAAQLAAEKDDWPWRYAKQVANMADWVKHELKVHLNDTHLVEEATIVAANRSFQIDHPVFKLLEPHWYRTLPLNAAARQTLVPSIILDLVGMKKEQSYEFIKWHYYTGFDFQGRYVPNDLEARGFPVHELDAADGRFKNYGYARNINQVWNTLRSFVAKMLEISGRYKHDQEVQDDDQLKAWSVEMQTNGRMPSFPTFTTKDQLIDAITMCIHIASPQHTAVNYLQNYYMVFVPNKPPALYKPLPTSLDDLELYVEKDVLEALPINHQRDWLLAAHIPWLLSFKTAEETSLLHYSISLYNLVRNRADATEEDRYTMAAAAEFYSDLKVLQKKFEQNSKEMTPGTVPYTVLDPEATAVSILI